MNKNIKVWYQKIGFYNNPFDIKANKFDNRVLGNEEKVSEIITKIRQGTVIYVDGEYGTGKTTLLKRIISEFGGHRNLFYHSCNSGEKLDLLNILKGKYRLFGKLFNIKGKGMILLLDEVQDLTQGEELNILSYRAKKYIKSIVLVGRKDDISFTREMRQAISNNMYSFGNISDKDAVRLIRRRIGDLPLLSNEAIKEINRISKGNPRFLLENCEDICKQAMDSGRRSVGCKEVNEFFSAKEQS